MSQQSLAFSPRALCNYIDNAKIDAPGVINVLSPASGQIIATCPISSNHQVGLAVASAKKAFQNTWSTITIKSRCQILIRFHQLVIKYSDELADLIVLEHGKTKPEALAEIAKGNETVEYALSLPQLVQGRVLEVSRGVTCSDERRPLGVVASIVPFNFPFMVPFWTIPIAIALGNTMIIKPSEKVPLTMFRVMDIFREAGLPDGVVNLVNGDASTVRAICDHPDIAAVTFVGTSEVARMLSHRCRLLDKRVLALGGAKNHLVAARDCNIDLTAGDVCSSFIGCSGQRCMAASVLLMVGPQPQLVEQIIAKACKFTPGQSNMGEMGPVIDAASLEKIVKYISDAEAAGVEILLDGRNWISESSIGFWIGPTVLKHKSKMDAAMRDEIFGPVISIYEVSSKEEAIDIENGNPYGNAACIYTESGATAAWFTKRFNAGMVGVNIGVPVPREPFSFGGTAASKFGDSDITGDGAIEFFSNRLKVTTKWGTPADKSWMN